MYGDYIAYQFWLGKVYDLTNHIILKLSNGARYAGDGERARARARAWGALSVSLSLLRCSMSVEDGAKLYDVCPHVSDSVGDRPARTCPAA